MKVAFLLLFMKVVMCSPVFADILFIDMNFSDKEVDTARKAATARGEKLVVYPETTDEDRKEINKMKEAIHQLEQNKEIWDKKFKDEYRKKEPNKEKIAVINKEIGPIYDQITVIDNKMTAFCTSKGYLHTNEKLNELVKKHNVSNGGFSSMIISSHHADSFFGITGEINNNEFQKIINDSPKAFSSMRSVYLWGCYTATKKALLAWKEFVPSAYVIAGWEGSGPKQDKALNHEFLTKLLMSEKGLSEQTTLKEAVTLFKSVPNIKASSAAYCIGNAYVTTKSSEILSDHLTCSSDDLANLKTAYSVVLKYSSANENDYEDVPKDTQNSALRDAYKTGRRLEHCSESTILKSNELDKLIKLIFDHQVRKNFVTVYKNELDGLAEILKQANAPKEAYIPAINDSDVSRQAILRANQALLSFISNKNNKLSAKDNTLLKTMNNRISNILEKHECIGPLWIESMEAKGLNQYLNESCAASQP